MPAAPSPPAGYSGTPLATKLGLKPGWRVCLIDAPAELPDWLAPLPAGLHWQPKPAPDTQLVHLFVTARTMLAQQLPVLRRVLPADAVLWVSWPRLPTDVTEDTIRELALPLGFVDVKVCAVSAVWSGLKLVVRKELR